MILGTDSAASIPAMGLLWEYLKLNWQAEGGIAWRTVTTVIFDQVENVTLLFVLTLNIYLVDVVPNVKDADTERKLLVPSRSETAAIVGGLFTVPQIVVHVWEYARIRLGTYGLSKSFLQANLGKKYMNYSEESRRVAGSIEVDMYTFFLFVPWLSPVIRSWL